MSDKRLGRPGPRRRVGLERTATAAQVAGALPCERLDDASGTGCHRTRQPAGARPALFAGVPRRAGGTPPPADPPDRQLTQQLAVVADVARGGEQEPPGGAVPAAGLRRAGQLAVARGLHQVAGEGGERADSPEALLDFLVPLCRLQAANVRVDEERGEGLQHPRAPEGLGLLQGQPHRGVVEHAAVHEATHADLQRPATLGDRMHLARQSGQRRPLRPRTGALGRLRVRTAVGGALAEHAGAEGEGKRRRGEERLEHHLGVHAHLPHLGEVRQRQPAVGRIERSGERLTLEADLSLGVGVEQERQHRALRADPEPAHVLLQRADPGDGEAHREPAARAKGDPPIEERLAHLDHHRLERGRGQHGIVGPVGARVLGQELVQADVQPGAPQQIVVDAGPGGGLVGLAVQRRHEQGVDASGRRTGDAHQPRPAPQQHLLHPRTEETHQGPVQAGLVASEAHPSAERERVPILQAGLLVGSGCSREEKEGQGKHHLRGLAIRRLLASHRRHILADSRCTWSRGCGEAGSPVDRALRSSVGRCARGLGTWAVTPLPVRHRLGLPGGALA
jgi:hypothetical protein